jgi:hypothetical protein
MSDIETLEKEIALLKEKVGLTEKVLELERELDKLRRGGKEYIPQIIWTTGGTTYTYDHGYETKTEKYKW